MLGVQHLLEYIPLFPQLFGKFAKYMWAEKVHVIHFCTLPAIIFNDDVCDTFWQ